MTSEIEVFVKDSLKINMLQELLSNSVTLEFQLNNSPSQNYSTQIHQNGRRVQVFGKFNISEDPAGEFLTIRPVMIDATLKIIPIISSGINHKKISVVRSTTKQVEREFDLTSDVTSIELVPVDKQKYLMKIVYNGIGPASVQGTQPERRVEPLVPLTTSSGFEQAPVEAVRESGDSRFDSFSFNPSTPVDSDPRFSSFESGRTVISNTSHAGEGDHASLGVFSQQAQSSPTPVAANTPTVDSELSRVENEITIIEEKQGELAQKRKSAIDHLERIEAEYKKDYAALEAELADIQSRMEADESIIEFYKDRDITPVEVLLQEAKLKLEEAELQIKLFIEAKQKKTSDIEGEIKSNKK